ncbi:MAG: hypothetical protein M1834_006639 [Cirrosporium novae-zelandiae]|nr:MAG: hypothetical protein M1834_006639 [Cirrosporium novae-zelandiae]
MSRRIRFLEEFSMFTFRELHTLGVPACLVLEAAKRELDYLTYVACRMPKKKVLVPDFQETAASRPFVN